METLDSRETVRYMDDRTQYQGMDEIVSMSKVVTVVSTVQYLKVGCTGDDAKGELTRICQAPRANHEPKNQGIKESRNQGCSATPRHIIFSRLVGFRDDGHWRVIKRRDLLCHDDEMDEMDEMDEQFSHSGQVDDNHHHYSSTRKPTS